MLEPCILQGYRAVGEPPASGSAAMLNAARCAAPRLACPEVQGVLVWKAAAGSCIWGWQGAEGTAARGLSSSCCTRA